MTPVAEADPVARLRLLARAERLALYQAAAEATQCYRRLADRGINPITAAVAAAERVEEWAHFPPGDVVDPTTHSQYYYHAHSADERVAGEHGHFHTFVRAQALFPELKPISPASGSEAGNIAHIVGISTDASGRLIRLFTTNRWVTDEAWYQADAVIGMLDRFDLTPDGPLHDLNRWVSAIVRMFRPQIIDLIRARDATIEAFRRAYPDRDVYEDRELRVTSERSVDFLEQICAIESAIGPA